MPFDHDFGYLANAINDYQKLKIRVVWKGFFNL